MSATPIGLTPDALSAMLSGTSRKHTGDHSAGALLSAESDSGVSPDTPSGFSNRLAAAVHQLFEPESTALDDAGSMPGTTTPADVSGDASNTAISGRRVAISGLLEHARRVNGNGLSSGKADAAGPSAEATADGIDTLTGARQMSTTAADTDAAQRMATPGLDTAESLMANDLSTLDTSIEAHRARLSASATTIAPETSTVTPAADASSGGFGGAVQSGPFDSDAPVTGDSVSGALTRTGVRDSQMPGVDAIAGREPTASSLNESAGADDGMARSVGNAAAAAPAAAPAAAATAEQAQLRRTQSAASDVSIAAAQNSASPAEDAVSSMLPGRWLSQRMASSAVPGDAGADRSAQGAAASAVVQNGANGRGLANAAGENPASLTARQSTGVSAAPSAAQQDATLASVPASEATADQAEAQLAESTNAATQSADRARAEAQSAAVLRGENGLTAAMSTSTRSAESTGSAMFHTLPGGTLRAVNVTPGDASLAPLGTAPETVDLQSPQGGRAMADNLRWMVSEGLQVATVRVSPAGLGPVTVRIDRQDDALSVAIAASQPAAREALESQLPRLRETLGATQQTVQVSVENGTAFDSRAGSQDLARQMAGQGMASGFGSGQQDTAGEREAGQDRSASMPPEGEYAGTDRQASVFAATGATGLFDEYI